MTTEPMTTDSPENSAEVGIDVQRLVRCSVCNAEITPEFESPEQGVCGVCLVYLQDSREEEARGEHRQIITLEMAHDAGFPEMEGMEW